MIKPFALEEVSPPTKSTLNFLHANSIPEYNSSKDSTVKRLDAAIETIICLASPFMAYISEIFTITDLYPRCFNGM